VRRRELDRGKRCAIVEGRFSDPVGVGPLHGHQTAGVDSPDQSIRAAGHVDGGVGRAVVEESMLNVAGIEVGAGDLSRVRKCP
jgi:hypothetical protein